MKVVIRFTASQELKALPILLRHSPGTILPDRTYVLSEEAVHALRDAGVTFTELSKEANAPSLHGATGARPERSSQRFTLWGTGPGCR
jgi:hypothetical protein